MKRALAVLVFSAAALSAAFASSGLVVAPHVDAPGTPLIHGHSPGAYRYPLSLLRLLDRTYHGPRITLDSAAGVTAAGVVFGLLALAAPRLPRPALRATARTMDTPDREAQWSPAVLAGPPRARSGV